MTIAPLASPHFLRARAIALNGLLLALWLWLYRPIFDYLAIIFTREDFRTNQIALVGIIILIALQSRFNFHPRLDTLPRPEPLPFLFILLGSLLFLASERYLDINTLSASLFGLATFGLMGLWLEPQPWRAGLPAAFLVVGVLPFGDHMETFIGYPMRIATAALVRDGLALFGITPIGVDAILILENSVAQIDLPCSGVKSLWTGALFLIAATWVERRPLNLRWLFVASAFAMILFITNFARVATLVVVGQILGLRLVAEMMHVPLGVTSFVLACAVAVGLLRLTPPAPAPWHGKRKGGGAPTWFSLSLITAIFSLSLFYAPRPHDGLQHAPPAWNFPNELVTESLPLKADEIEWLTRDGAESADRRQFKWRGITGTMILVPSMTWRAHHRPERCFEVYGLQLDESRAQIVTPDFSVRFVSLGQRIGKNFSATYWFQSATRSTDDYGTRMWADVTTRQRWVLVSILFDRAEDANDADVRALYLALHEAVEEYLSPE